MEGINSERELIVVYFFFAAAKDKNKDLIKTKPKQNDLVVKVISLPKTGKIRMIKRKKVPIRFIIPTSVLNSDLRASKINLVYDVAVPLNIRERI